MSSAFEAQLQRDLDVFFNPNEFAALHNINGTDGVICILEEQDIRALRPGLGRFEGTFKNTLILQIKESDWQANQWDEPRYNEFVTVDQIRYCLKNVALVGGEYEMLLEAIE